jgi:hypothetical protein
MQNYWNNRQICGPSAVSVVKLIPSVSAVVCRTRYLQKEASQAAVFSVVADQSRALSRLQLCGKHVAYKNGCTERHELQLALSSASDEQ